MEVLDQFEVAQSLYPFQQGLCLPMLAPARCWKPAEQELRRPFLYGRGGMLHAHQVQSCWQEGTGSDLNLSIKTRNVYNSMQRAQSHNVSLN